MKLFVFGIIGLLTLSISCSTSNSTQSPVQQKNEGGSSQKNTDPASVTVEGTFRSVKGVMNPLSCYCYNSGYLTTVDGKSIEVCFENDDAPTCSPMTVTGYYKTIKITPESTSPCPAGEKTLLIVQTSSCK